jgi:integrase
MAEYARHVRVSADFLTTVFHLEEQDGLILIPYRDGNNNVVSIQVRRQLERNKTGRDTRFFWKQGGTCLYGAWMLSEWGQAGVKRVWLCEGASDVHVCWFKDVKAVGAPGADTFKAEWASMLLAFPEIASIQEPGKGGETFVKKITEQRVTFEHLTEDLKNDYKVNARQSLRSVELSIRHLAEFFAGDRAVHITTDRLRAYIAERQEQEAANASINRELSALKRAFSLAQQAGKLFHRPYIPSLEENNARQGFLEHGDFLRLREELPDYLKDPVSFLYLSGWRKGEMQSLEWRDVGTDVIRLRRENSKNKNPRLLPLRGELAEIIERARQARKPDCVFVFHDNGQKIGDFRKAWRNACVAAGLGRFEKTEDGKVYYLGLIVHDLRRSAIRNMVKAGIREKVAMSLSGHRTRSVFDRYHIVSEKIR